MFHTRTYRWVLLSAICLMTLVAGSIDAAPPAGAADATIPHDVDRLWQWFPADTETMIVARDVPVRSPFDVPKQPRELTDDERHALQQQGFIEYTKLMALGRLLLVGGGNMMQSGKYLPLLGEKPVPLVVYGGRAYQHVSAFGTLRYHGASVIVVADETQADLNVFFAAVAKDAEKRDMQGHEVYYFPASKDEMEPVFEFEPWQGTYLTRLAPTVLLCATSDVFLKEMFARNDKPPADRALPTNLPLWEYVDVTASTWGLRRNPPVEKQQLAGLVWLMQPGGRPTFEAFYLPTVDGNVEFAAQSWLKKVRDGKLVMDPELEELIEVLPDGVTKVTIPIGEIGRRVNLPMFQIYGLQGHLAAW